MSFDLLVGWFHESGIPNLRSFVHKILGHICLDLFFELSKVKKTLIGQSQKDLFFSI